MSRKYAKVLVIALVTIVFLIAILVFTFRNVLLQRVVEKTQKSIQDKYHLTLKFHRAYFSKLDEVAFENVELKDSASFEIFSVQQAKIEVSLPQIFLARIRLKTIVADSIQFFLIDKNDVLNLEKFKQKGTTKKTVLSNQDFVLTRAIKYLAMFSSTEISLNQIRIIFKDTIESEQIYIPQFELKQKQFSAYVSNKYLADTLHASGTFDIDNKWLECNVNHTSDTIGAFSFLRKNYNLNIDFDTIYFSTKWNATKTDVHFDQTAELKNLQVEHWRLAPQPIVFPNLKSEISGTISSTALQIDSTSKVVLQNILLDVFAYAEKRDSNFHAALKIEMPKIDANDFFSSLPDGMFSSLKGISCNGRLAYKLNFDADSKNLDALVFESEMKRENFSLKHFGAEKLTMINDDFIHDVFVNGRLVRQIFVGGSNANFTPYNSISPYLIASVLQSEDPSFMQHGGFVESAFREAIIQDIKERRFARGGSTITMQLVKNVFLSRDKNISRKVEEALLVFLIENMRLVSKERMLEVYLNIIEWGPNVYGIGEAANFYFKKKPSALNLQESIFLAGIIPNPKYFKYQVDSSGKLKPHFEHFAHILMNRMLLRNRISEVDTAMFLPEIEFNGTALKYISPTDFDTLQNEKLMIENALPAE